VLDRMFRSLYEGFADSDTINSINQNIVRYQSVEPNSVIFTQASGFTYPNAGNEQHKATSNSSAFQAAIGGLNTVTNTRTGVSLPAVPNLGSILSGIPNDIQVNLLQCRRYNGLAGLQKLKKDVGNTNVPARCGWRYQPGQGPVPLVSQGCYASQSGPLDPANPPIDKVGNGIQFFWDLDAAEKAMINDICKTAKTCQDLTLVPASALGDFQNVCGYCKSSKKVIPINRNGNTVTSKYTDAAFQCDPSNIVTADNAATQCPAPGPNDPPSFQFPCMSGPLGRDCLALASYYAGCSPSGSLAAALSAGTNPNDYAADLRNKKSFKTYQTLASPVLNDSIIKDGNATLYATFMNLYNVNRSMYDQTNPKLAVAARDLCQENGLFETYDFCSETQDSDTDYAVKCMQNYFLQSGGTTQGTAYPTQVTGQKWGDYKKTVTALVAGTQSTDPKVQRSMMNQLSGLNLQAIPTGLTRSEDNQGCEVFWFDLQNGEVLMGRRPQLSSSGSNLPSFNAGDGVVEQTGLADYVKFVSFCDLRPSTDKSMIVGTVTDDGARFTLNQDLYNITNPANAMNADYDQGPTWHNTPWLTLSSESSSRPNIFSTVWSEKGGGAMFTPYFIFNGDGSWRTISAGDTVDPVWKDICYFTQEPEAPSVSFEVYVRKNTTAFQEKRLWSNALTSTATQATQIKPATGINDSTNALALTNQIWKTNKKIAFNAFRTITVCFKLQDVPSPSYLAPLMNFTAPGSKNGLSLNLSQLTGKTASLQLNAGFSKYGMSMTALDKNKGTYSLQLNTWYMATIMMDPVTKTSKQLQTVRFFVEKLSSLAAGNVLDTSSVSTWQAPSVLFDEYKNNRGAAGPVSLGGTGVNALIAWLHFFDASWDTSSPQNFKKEATQSWLGRWFE